MPAGVGAVAFAGDGREQVGAEGAPGLHAAAMRRGGGEPAPPPVSPDPTEDPSDAPAAPVQVAGETGIQRGVIGGADEVGATGRIATADADRAGR
jgi:hypothetical protein